MKKIKLCLSKGCDKCYVARLVSLFNTDFEPHPNAERLKIARVLGFRVIVGIDAGPGDYVFFPAGSIVSGSFLSFTNNYADSTKNKDKNVSGTFEGTGRVKAVKLRGELSEGWICKESELVSWISALTVTSISDLDLDFGTGAFDTISYVYDKEKISKIWLCKKYIAKRGGTPKKPRMRGKVPGRLVERVPKDQFKFHYETELLKMMPWVIKPESYIWITKKIDGTSGISSYTQIKRKPFEFWKPKRYYHHVYSSSGVIRSKDVNKKAGPGWFGVDIWGEADKVVGPLLDHGMTAYYEIVGYLQTGGFIQKADDFGCTKPEGGKFRIGQNFRVLIYRLTITTQEGFTVELNPRQVKDWAESKGLESVKILYEGLAKNLYPDLNPEQHFSEDFVGRLSKDKKLGMEELETECKNKVPQEGLVIRVGEKAYKLKTEAHLLWKQEWLEKEGSDIEDLERNEDE